MQYDFLENNPEIFIVGAALKRVDENNKDLGEMRAPLNNEGIKQAMPKTAEDRYSVFYFQSQAAMKAHDFKSAISFSDSAYHYLEDMYRTALQGKAAYYTSF